MPIEGEHEPGAWHGVAKHGDPEHRPIPVVLLEPVEG